MRIVFFMLLALTGWARPQALMISECTETALDQALVAAVDGDRLVFTCAGTIPMTTTKVISADITITAAPHTVTFDGEERGRILFIEEGAEVSIRGVDFVRGNAESGGSAINSNGVLTLTDSRLAGNVHALANFGTLTLERVTFVGNRGAALYNSGLAYVRDSTFTGNRRGVDNASGDLFVQNSVFSGNVATERGGMGAGIANSGSVVIIGSTFYENYAPAGGSAVGTHRGGEVVLAHSLLLGSADSASCFGGMIDGGGNVQSPGTSCGELVPVLPGS